MFAATSQISTTSCDFPFLAFLEANCSPQPQGREASSFALCRLIAKRDNKDLEKILDILVPTHTSALEKDFYVLFGVKVSRLITGFLEDPHAEKRATLDTGISKWNLTPLHVAALVNNCHAMALLLAKGASCACEISAYWSHRCQHVSPSSA